jgi:hypothetical protein
MDQKTQALRIPQNLEAMRIQRECMAPVERDVLDAKMLETAHGALQNLFTKLRRLPQLKLKEPLEKVLIALTFCPLEEAARSDGAPGASWGRANPEQRVIVLLDLLCFAPKVVVRTVVTHEACHVLFSIVDPECLTPVEIGPRARGYAGDRQFEEQWVVNLTEKVGCDELSFIAWTMAVEQEGTNWKKHYYAIRDDVRAHFAKQKKEPAQLKAYRET